MTKQFLLLTVILPLALSYQVEAAAPSQSTPKTELITHQFVLSDQTKQTIHAFLSGQTHEFNGPIQLIDIYIGQLSDDEILALAQQNQQLPSILRQFGIAELADFISGDLVQTQVEKF